MMQLPCGYPHPICGWNNVNSIVIPKCILTLFDFIFCRLSFQIGQTVFQGLDTLNLIQSIVYPIAYHTSENLLVSAPTGAGKTNVALLTIAQLLRSHIQSDNILDLKAFKVSRHS